MKKADYVLFLVLVLLLAGLGGCGDNTLEFLSDKSSDEACRYQVSQDLDDGNYDAVLESSCADALQRGAAYFGKAGFDINDVINELSSAASETEPLDLYLSALVRFVDDTVLTNLDLSKQSYESIQPSAEEYRDAQFYITLVSAVRSLALMKMIIDSDGDGAVSDCDINSNGTPDDADAAACALLLSEGQSCQDVSSSITPTDIAIQNRNGTYRGITVTVPGQATASCPATYRQLHYRTAGGGYRVVLTGADTCTEQSPDSSRHWPCPVETNGMPVDLVQSIDQSLSDSITSLNNSFGVSNDVSNAVQDIRDDACGGDACTSTEVSDYITTQL